MKFLISNFKFLISKVFGAFVPFGSFGSSEKGQSIIELLVTIGLVAIITPALFAGFFATQSGRAQLQQRQIASQLVKEGQEAARAYREANWNTFSTLSGTYYASKSGTTWILSTTNTQPVAGFTRTLVIGNVSRDTTTGNIVSSGGVNDPSTKKVTTTVCWSNCSAVNSSSATEYLTRYVTNASFTDTLVTDFNKGIYTNTQAVTPGQVTLQFLPAQGNWCSPNLAAAASTTLAGNHQSATAINAFAAYSGGAGHGYTTSGADGKGDSMDTVTVTDPASPASPSASVAGQYNIPSNNGKTSGVFVDTSTNLAYIAANQKITVDVVDLATLTEKYTYTDSGGGTGVSVYVSAGVGFVIDGKQLYSFNTTTNPGKELGKLSTLLAGNGLKIMVYGTKAYIATDSTSSPLQSVDVTDPAHMGTPQTIAVSNGSQPGIDVSLDTVTGTTLDFVSNYKNASTSNLFVINLSNNSVAHSYNTAGMNPNSVAFVSGGRYVLVGGTSGQQYQVWDTTANSTTPCGGLANVSGSSSVNSISFLQEPDGDVFAYVLATIGNAIKFYAIPGGNGGAAGYVASGTYVSGTSWSPALNLPSANPIAFNNFQVTYKKPTNTDIQFQVAVGDIVGGTCSAFVYAGPGQPPTTGFFATPNTYSTNAQTATFSIPFGTNVSGYANPGKCFRYSVYLSDTNGNTTTTPELDDITVNYSQ